MDTFIEMKIRMYIATKRVDIRENLIFKVIKQLISNLLKGCLKSFTSDRVKEFGCYK